MIRPDRLDGEDNLSPNGPLASMLSSRTLESLSNPARTLKAEEALAKKNKKVGDLVEELDRLAAVGQREMVRGGGITLPSGIRSTRFLRNGNHR